MRTLQRATAALIYPAILWLGVACDRDPQRPSASAPVVGPRADLITQTGVPDWVTRALLGLDQLVVDPATSLVQPEDPPNDPITVVPFEFDPNHTSLVRAFWMRGIGCPTNATAVDFFGVPTAVTDPACMTGDPKDSPGKNKGLLLVKTGPSVPNFASAGAVLNGVKGIMLTELGYDIRKGTAAGSPVGSHCGAGAPRFNVVLTSDPPGTVHFVACNSPPAMVAGVSAAWLRLRWGAAELAAAFPPIVAGSEVSSITIIFDEGTDFSGGPDMFGLAVLDNIDVNGTLVGRGPGN